MGPDSITQNTHSKKHQVGDLDPTVKFGRILQGEMVIGGWRIDGYFVPAISQGRGGTRTWRRREKLVMVPYRAKNSIDLKGDDFSFLCS